jgi:hypothetical protein
MAVEFRIHYDEAVRLFDLAENSDDPHQFERTLFLQAALVQASLANAAATMALVMRP